MGDDESYSQDTNEQSQASQRPKRKAYTQMMNLPSDQFMWETFEMGADLSGDEKQILPANPEARPELSTPKSETSSGLSSLLDGEAEGSEPDNPQVTTFSSLLNTGQFQMHRVEKKTDVPKVEPHMSSNPVTKIVGGITDLPGADLRVPPAGPPVEFAAPEPVFPASAAAQNAAPYSAPPSSQQAPPPKNAAPYSAPAFPPQAPPPQSAAPYAVPSFPQSAPAPYPVPSFPEALPPQSGASYPVPSFPQQLAPQQPAAARPPEPVAQPTPVQQPPETVAAPPAAKPALPHPTPRLGSLAKPGPLPGTSPPSPVRPPLPVSQSKAPIAQSHNASDRLPFPADSMEISARTLSTSESLTPADDNPFAPLAPNTNPYSPPSGTFSPFAPPKDASLSQTDSHNPFKPYTSQGSSPYKPNPNFDPLDEPPPEMEPSSAHPVLKRAVDITRPQLPQLEMPGSTDQQLSSQKSADGFGGRLKKFCVDIGSAFKSLFKG
ncbi:MAG: hypothetical protein K2X93_27955 [Candidatus Obscuribacterales bacterium]|nr:hypothetical protein [Candidatus Obscuribacterales bacterium]